MPEANRTSSRGPCRALYPGSFKPPHRGHYQSVISLLADPEIDEVVVIISNRCRLLPQTRLAIDAETARSIWNIYVADLPRVRVEVAEHTAIENALGYFDRAEPGEKLLYCMGDSDDAAGDDRFSEIVRLGRETGISASIVTTATETRSTELRALLAAGADGRREFMTRVPDHLPEHEKDTVWSLCRNGVKPVEAIFNRKIASVLRARNMNCNGSLNGLDVQTVDPTFALTTSGGSDLVIKYAGDTVGAGTYAGPLSQKPKQRLAVERRVLKHLAAFGSGQCEVPRVVFFDKRTRTLAVTQVRNIEISVSARMDRMITDPRTACRIGQFLAELHSLPVPRNPFWGTDKAEVDNWDAIMRRCLRVIGGSTESSDTRQRWVRSLARSADEPCRHVVHLNFRPDNIVPASDTLGVIGFERSSSHGDPAFDLGTIAGHLLLHAHRSMRMDLCIANIRRLLRAYSDAMDRSGADRAGRAMAFASVTMLEESNGRLSNPMHPG